jgi:hypothetical protein
LVYLDSAYSMEIKFSRRLQKDPETLRRLAHRAVDLLANAGHYAWLADSVAGDLVCLADDFVVKNLTDLIHEARTPGKKVSRG